MGTRDYFKILSKSLFKESVSMFSHWLDGLILYILLTAKFITRKYLLQRLNNVLKIKRSLTAPCFHLILFHLTSS